MYRPVSFERSSYLPSFICACKILYLGLMNVPFAFLCRTCMFICIGFCGLANFHIGVTDSNSWLICNKPPLLKKLMLYLVLFTSFADWHLSVFLTELKYVECEDISVNDLLWQNRNIYITQFFIFGAIILWVFLVLSWSRELKKHNRHWFCYEINL